jgi:hypothetical protein
MTKARQRERKKRRQAELQEAIRRADAGVPWLDDEQKRMKEIEDAKLAAMSGATPGAEPSKGKRARPYALKGFLKPSTVP